MNNTLKPWYFAYPHIRQIGYIVKPLEITQHTIIIPGIKQNSDYDPFYKLHKLEFRCKHSRKIVKIIDSIVTPEMIVLYVDKDARKYPYNKCVLISKIDYNNIIPNMYVFCKK